MLSYFLKCRKKKQQKTESENPKVRRTKNGRIMVLSKCSVCNSKKSKFFKEQEAKRLFCNLLGAKIPILGDAPSLNNLF